MGPPSKLPLPSRAISTLSGHTGTVRSVRFNAEGEYCLTGGSDRTIQLSNPYKGTTLKVYQGHSGSINEAVSSDDSSQVASGSDDKLAILWNVESGVILRKFRGHLARINCVAFNADASLLFSGSYDRTVSAWDCRAKSKDPVQTLDQAKDSVTCVKVSDADVLVGSVDGYVRNYDLRMGMLRSDFVAAPVTSVVFTLDRKCILVGSLDNTVRLLDCATGELLGEYTGHKSSETKTDCCLNPTDAFIASGSEDGRVCFWDVVEGTMVHELGGTGAGITSIDYHPSEPFLLSADLNGTVKLWGLDQ